MKPDLKSVEEFKAFANRRTFLKRSLTSLGAFAFGDLLAESASQAPWRGTFAGGTNFRPKVKRVIHLCMAGGPSHLESFDYKPEASSGSTARSCPSLSPRASNSRSCRGRH